MKAVISNNSTNKAMAVKAALNTTRQTMVISKAGTISISKQLLNTLKTINQKMVTSFNLLYPFLVGKKNQQDTDLDEDEVQQNHRQVYQNGNAGNMSADAIGSAAAMNVLKQFTSGSGSSSSSGAGGGGGGGLQSMLIGRAMSEAAKLFDQSGGAASGNKQDAVSSAGGTILKLLLKSKFSGTTGGANSGGLSSLMSSFLR